MGQLEQGQDFNQFVLPKQEVSQASSQGNEMVASQQLAMNVSIAENFAVKISS